MRKSTRVIEVIEMTREEEDYLWSNPDVWKKNGIYLWNTHDGNNDILLIGEEVYRPVCIVEKS